MMLKVREEYGGRKAQCPKCSEPLVIPKISATESTRVSKLLQRELSGHSTEAAPNRPAPPEIGIPHILTESSGPDGGSSRGSTAARVGRGGRRTIHPAVVVLAVAVTLVVVVGGVAFFLKSPENPPPGALADRLATDVSAAFPGIPAPSVPSTTTLVFDWPEMQRPGSIVQIDGVKEPVPSAGPVQFKLKPGEHELVILRRGYEAIETRITLGEDEYHYVPQWKEPAAALADSPDPSPAGPAEAELAPAVHTEPNPPPPQIEHPKLADDEPEKAPKIAAGPTPKKIPTEPTPMPQAPPPSFDSPRELLAAKGLGEYGEYWSVSEESELRKRLTTAQKLWRQVVEAQRNVEKAQETVARGNAVMLGHIQTMGQLGAQLKVVRTVADNNRIVGAMDELKSRTLLASRQFKELEKSRDRTLGAALSKSSEFEEHLLEFRGLYDKVKNDYQVLSADTAVTEAIRQFNETSDKTYRLGPRTLFDRLGKQLEGLESKVFSEAIPLRRGDGELWYVSVAFNGRHAKEMAIDTGASVIAMSWATAQELQLTPGADAPTVYAQVADGSVVPCRQVFAEVVRVGKFTVENVECMVMSPGLPDSTPLLGLSFFKNFSFRIDSGKGRLIMSQIDTSETTDRRRGGASGGPAEDRK